MEHLCVIRSSVHSQWEVSGGLLNSILHEYSQVCVIVRQVLAILIHSTVCIIICQNKFQLFISINKAQLNDIMFL